jgi:twitching motility protein PilI
MILPSEALNREFVLDEDTLGQLVLDSEFATITTHAVLVGDIGLLLPVGEVSELVDHLPVCKLPNTPGWFSGVISLRGNITPLFDLHELFGVAVTASKRRMIVVGRGDTAVSFWVDDMPRMVTLGVDDDVEGDPPLPDFVRTHASRFFLKDGQIWIDWDVKQFFTALGKLL